MTARAPIAIVGLANAAVALTDAAVALTDAAVALDRGAVALVPAGPAAQDDLALLEQALAGGLRPAPCPPELVTTRDHALALADRFTAREAAVPTRRRELVDFAVDELCANALRTGAPVTLSIHVTEDHVDVFVTDDSGTLDLDVVRRRLAAALRSGGAPLAPPQSAGLGLYLLFRRTSWLHIGVEPGVRTQVLTRIALAPRSRPFAALSLLSVPGGS